MNVTPMGLDHPISRFVFRAFISSAVLTDPD